MFLCYRILQSINIKVATLFLIEYNYSNAVKLRIDGDTNPGDQPWIVPRPL